MKIKAWGVKQGVWGGDPVSYWFTSKEARDEYYNSHDYCDKLRCKNVDAEYAYNNMQELKAALEW